MVMAKGLKGLVYGKLRHLRASLFFPIHLQKENANVFLFLDSLVINNFSRITIIRSDCQPKLLLVGRNYKLAAEAVLISTYAEMAQNFFWTSMFFQVRNNK
jgi:hypothetical protein